MLIFGTFKEPNDRTWNAVKSWTNIGGGRVLLFGEECAPYADEFGVEVQTDVERIEGLPRIDSMFAKAQAVGESPLLFVNGDIIMAPDICPPHLSEYLMIGRRTDVPLVGRMDFGLVQLWDNLRTASQKYGKLLPPCGCDYFLFTLGLYESIPPFVIARFSYDNWLIYDPLKRGIPVVDATEKVLALHQVHPEDNSLRRCELAKYNYRLAKEAYPEWTAWDGWVSQATWRLQ